MADKSFPTKEDVALWDKYDATYGMDEAGELRPGAPNPVMSMDEMFLLQKAYSADPSKERREALEAAIKREPMDDKRRELLMRNFIASRRSGIAALGLDPAKTVLSREEKPANPMDNLSGFALQDYTYTKRDPRASGSTATHEGIHRGITELVDAKEERAYSLLDKANNLRQELSQKKSVTKKELDELDRLEAEALSNLNQRNKIKGIDPRVSDQSFDQNELAVRGLMQKFYGDVEKQGTLVAPPQLYEGGAQFLAQNPDLISTIEQMATEELKRRGRPMGPR